jgi:hypothetical protein
MDSRTASIHPLHFGRREPRPMEAATEAEPIFSDDLRLFATTFVAGFLFLSLYLA